MVPTVRPEFWSRTALAAISIRRCRKPRSIASSSAIRFATAPNIFPSFVLISKASSRVRPSRLASAITANYRRRNGVVYFLFLDAASGSENGDSYAISVGHKEGDQIVIDAVCETIPPFSPAAVVDDVLLPLCKAYKVTRAWGDNYAGNFPKELVRKAGLYYDLWPQHKSEIYRDPLLPLINSKRITLPRIDRLINQCCQLERSVKRSGRDEISHPTHGHDDLINSVAGAAAVAMRAALAEQRVPLAPPTFYSRQLGFYGGGAPAANTPPPPHFQRKHEPWRDFVGPDAIFGSWPGSNPFDREW